MSLIGSRSDQLSTNGMLSRSAFIEPEHLPISDLVNAALAQKLDYKLWARQQLLNSASLLLDFENNRYVRDEGIEGWMTERPLTDLLTFSRAGSATGINRLGVLQEVGPDIPVFENSGLRLRPAETNLLKNSDTLAGWTLSSGVRVEDSGIAALGSDKNWVALGEGVDEIARTHYFGDVSAAAIGAGVKATASMWVRKMSGGRYVGFLTNDAISSNHWLATIDPATGDVGAAAGVTVEVIDESPDAYRFNVTYTTAATTANLQVRLAHTLTNAQSYQGDGRVGAYIFGVQFNAGDPIPYIPTTSAAVTRPADDARISGNALAGIWNPNEGAILLDLDITLPAVSASTDRVFVVSSNQHPDAYTVFADASGLRFFTSDSTGRPQPDTRIGFISSGRHKLGINRKADGSIDMWLNGGKAIASASAPAGSATIARFAGPYSGNVFTPMLYRRAALFSEALDDQQMEILTS